jgi:YcxB-like protein
MVEARGPRYPASQDDYAAAMRLVLLRMRAPKMCLASYCMIIILGAALWVPPFSSWFGPVLVGFGACALWVSLRLSGLLPGPFKPQNPAFVGDYIFEFSEDSVSFDTSGHRSEYEWSYFKEAWEDQRIYCFLSQVGSLVVVSKRAFASREQEQEFRSLLLRKVPGSLS